MSESYAVGGMKTIPIAALATLSPNVLRGKAVADDKEEIGKKLIYDGKLDGEAYTTIGNLKTCRIVNGKTARALSLNHQAVLIAFTEYR